MKFLSGNLHIAIIGFFFFLEKMEDRSRPTLI